MTFRLPGSVARGTVLPSRGHQTLQEISVLTRPLNLRDVP